MSMEFRNDCGFAAPFANQKDGRYVHKLRIACIVVSVLLIADSGFAQAFKPYPGATKLAKESEEATKLLAGSGEGSIYTTTDSYEKVVAFYKGFAREHPMPGLKATKLPSGQELVSTVFIFDGAANLRTSKCWAKVQRPYIGSVKMNGATAEYGDIRDLTAIVVSQKK